MKWLSILYEIYCFFWCIVTRIHWSMDDCADQFGWFYVTL